MVYTSLNKFKTVLEKGVEIEASDIHISADSAVYFRRKNKLKAYNEFIFDKKEISLLLEKILNQLQLSALKKDHAVDCAYTYNQRRFRLNVFMAMGSFNIAVRLIGRKILDIGIFIRSDVLKNQLRKNHGLILVCGATGTGKSTTLASILDYMNKNFVKHIITLEDPIEYVFEKDKSLIQQRELNRDFYDFSQAVKMALRQDPDILMIGEIRDSSTMKAVLTAAETGHLVLGTLHAGSVVEAIMRMESFFPLGEQNSICTQIAQSLNCIIVQKLLELLNGELACCMEILLAQPAVKNIIRQGQNQQLISQMQLNKQMGMQTMQEGLNYFLENNLIDKTSINNIG